MRLSVQGVEYSADDETAMQLHLQPPLEYEKQRDTGADPEEKKDLSMTRTADVERLQKERAGVESGAK